MENSASLGRLGKGSLLIASPDIDAGLFFRSVLLVCEHSPSGSFALILNKPIDLDLPEELIPPSERVNERVQVRAGGPIQPSQMIMLHSEQNASEQSLEVCKGVYLGGDLQLLREMISKADGPNAYLCFGYMGWGMGSLEREILSHEWFIHPASSHLVFETPSDKLWRTVLREMGGKYATLAMIPDDPSLN